MSRLEATQPVRNPEYYPRIAAWLNEFLTLRGLSRDLNWRVHMASTGSGEIVDLVAERTATEESVTAGTALGVWIFISVVGWIAIMGTFALVLA